MQKYRIEGLSDLVFGLALSIGSLAMIGQPVLDSTDILEGIVGFIFGFLVIVNVWVSYTNVISDNEIETKMDFRLNLALLMLVAIEPYLLYLLGKDEPELANFASMAYAVNIGLIMLILAALHHRRIVSSAPQETGEQNRMDRNHFILIGSIFLISALPIFWQEAFIFNTNLRFIIWMLAILPGIFIRAKLLRHHADDKDR